MQRMAARRGNGMQHPVQGRLECCQLHLPTTAIGLCQHLMPSRKSIQCKKSLGSWSSDLSGLLAYMHQSMTELGGRLSRC